jgi:hypothetical protein
MTPPPLPFDVACPTDARLTLGEFQVRADVRVIPRAVCDRPLVRTLIRSARVFFGRYRLNMRRIDTSSVSAYHVVELMVFVDIAHEQRVRVPVG